MSLDFSVYAEYWRVFAEGLGMTALIFAVSVVLSLAIGFAIAFLRLWSRRMFRTLARIHIEFSRNLPFIVLLFLLFFGLPALGIHAPAAIVGTFALSLYGSAYYAEIFRGAIQSVPRGQWDAARALGLTDAETLKRVILPQMMGYFIPPATNQAIMLIKESAVLSTITVIDLTMAGLVVQGYSYRPLEVFLIIALLYWLLTAAVSRAGVALEARLQPGFSARTEKPRPREAVLAPARGGPS